MRGAAGVGLEYTIDGVINYDQLFYIGNEGYSAWEGPFTITFDLGSSYELNSFTLWNNGGENQHDGEGIQEFSLSFYDSATHPVGGALAHTASDILAPQLFTFDPATPVQFVELTINSNHSAIGTSTERGYAVFFMKQRFDGAAAQQPVPEPATLLLSAFGLAGFTAVSRNKRWMNRRN